jgi:hypothetical protein
MIFGVGPVGFEPSDRIPLGYYLSDIHMVRENLSLSSTIIASFGEKEQKPGSITQDSPNEVASDITSDTDRPI